MSTEPLRTLFCIGNNQNFFDLPKAEIGPVWIGHLDDALDAEEHGRRRASSAHSTTTPTWSARPTAGPGRVTCWPTCAISRRSRRLCNLLRTTMIGEYALWKYFKIEARMGRELTIRDDVEI